MTIKIRGKIIHGEHRGKILGFPTANLDRREYVRKKMRIKFGVWSGLVRYKLQANSYKLRKAGIVIGPLDERRLPKIEAHLLNFKGNLYGKKISIYLNTYLRPFKKFKNLQTLRAQIQKDLQKIKKL